jgi:hypothetical protein
MDYLNFLDRNIGIIEISFIVYIRVIVLSNYLEIIV